ncbi:F0F1 ATP synthase subunit epsilon [Saccharospirillum salsuginis]|uniref:ATP synthase epsilon chain n=1 Tax=Saccharospirillum salsuginis TaxID=418750 RepID=A0A918KFR9_9GAMM|nr:F0F1 ATP synthase subunit epsilon [Saccharospirillum salsuginis]GGX61876.1 F0F1 ATP synthase subunit epsilon [Saccharospirillum salsuginis]
MTEQTAAMQLTVFLPTGILLETRAHKIIAEAPSGEFCLLPRHIDYVASLEPGILIYTTPEGDEGYVGLDRGVLVKAGPEVRVSAFDGVAGTRLDQLTSLVESRYIELDEQDRKARAALSRLEAGTLRGFHELQERYFET